MSTVHYMFPYTTYLSYRMRYNFKMAEASGGESSLFSNAAAASDQSDGTAGVESQKEKPICILCLGMAGSGKTTFVQVILLF